jgi:uncharacterized LabA/DUF88 family protein
MVFIDGSNTFWGLQNWRRKVQQNILIDYGKLVEHVAVGRQVRGKYYYCSHPPIIGEKQARFMDMLRQNGITVVPKKLKLRGVLPTGKPRVIEKGVDVALVTDLLSLAWEEAYEDAVLVSGDADYTGAVEKVKSKGKIVEVVSWHDSLSRELKLVASKVTYLDDLIDKVKLLTGEPDSNAPVV